MRRACSEAVREWAAPTGVVDAGSGVSRSGNSTDGISGSWAAGVAGADSGSATGLSDLVFLGFFFLRSSSIWRGGVSVVVEGRKEVLMVDAPSFWQRPVFLLWQPLRRRLRNRPLVVNRLRVRWMRFWLDVRWELKMSLKMEVWISGGDVTRQRLDSRRVRTCQSSRSRALRPSQANSFPSTLDLAQASIMPGTWGILIRTIGWALGIDKLMSECGNEAPSGSADAPKTEGPRPAEGMGLSCPL